MARLLTLPLLRPIVRLPQGSATDQYYPPAVLQRMFRHFSSLHRPGGHQRHCTPVRRARWAQEAQRDRAARSSIPAGGRPKRGTEWRQHRAECERASGQVRIRQPRVGGEDGGGRTIDVYDPSQWSDDDRQRSVQGPADSVNARAASWIESTTWTPHVSVDVGDPRQLGAHSSAGLESRPLVSA